MQSRLLVRGDSPLSDSAAPASPTNTPAVYEQIDIDARAKRYSRIKMQLGLTSVSFSFVLALGVVASGLSRLLEELVRQSVAHDYGALLVFAALLTILHSTMLFPLRFYSGFLLEHRYGLSNQSFGRWLWEQTKGMLVGMPLSVPLLLALYYCLRSYGSWWWLPVGVVMVLVSVVLARLGPTLIFPLFYRFEPLPEGSLRERILTLCAQVGMKAEGVFTFNMSKNTKKANAAFAGIGKAKRIILADTLIAGFTEHEIETVFAHELGHYKLKHLHAMMLTGTLSTFLGLYLTSKAYEASLRWFEFSSLDQLAALPLLGLWLGVYSLITGPLSNLISRAHEREADQFAIRLTNDPASFVSALTKLSRTNLADPAPHPLVEFLFHSHPSIEKRIQLIRSDSS